MNRRDEQIRALKERKSNLRADRLEQCYLEIVQGYEAATMVNHVCHVVEIRDRSPSDFRVLSNGETRLLSHFNDPSFSWDFYCRELGRSVALGEERYLSEQLATLQPSGTVIEAANPKFGALLHAIDHLVAHGYTPDVVLAPISLSVAFYSDRDLKIDWSAWPETLVVPRGPRLKTFWSSQITPLARLIVFDSRAGLWNVKLDPETGHRLTVAIGEPASPREAVMFLAETVVKYEMADATGFYVVELKGEPHEEKTEVDSVDID